MSDIKNKVIEEIKKIFDPEIPVNIYELGLIYKLDVDEKNKVNIDHPIVQLQKVYQKRLKKM